MANDCFYSMIAVSKDKSALERLIKIMEYKDDEYFIYRCFSVSNGENIEKENDYYYVDITGEVAWSCTHWFETKEDKDCLIALGWDKETGKEINGTAHYISLDLLCKKLGIGVEVFSQESGCCFQEHYLVNHDGTFVFNESTNWELNWCDENGDELDEPIEIGGFDYYEEFSSVEEIYGEKTT